MSTLGATAGQVGFLTGVAQLTGTWIDALAMGMERLSLNVQKSAKDAFNPAAQGLKVLGLNARELIGLNSGAVFREAVCHRVEIRTEPQPHQCADGGRRSRRRADGADAQCARRVLRAPQGGDRPHRRRAKRQPGARPSPRRIRASRSWA